LEGAIPLFATTTFVSSGLLFLVQPMFAKLALPRLGGSPSVWNTCILFFQTTLLLGYLYAHFSTRWLGIRRQIELHLILLFLPLALLPLSLGDGQPPTSANPVWWLLRTLTLTVGLPFFVVSTSAPLLQRWFAALPVPSARDPYFLYSASNLGSMLALLGYPLVFEPTLGTRRQTWIWALGYVVLIALTATCGLLVRGFTGESRQDAVSAPAVAREPVSVRQRLQWMLLSFIPSSLMLGVTTHISTDIAAVPLLWVLPLAMYLLTFVFAFSPRELLPHRWLVRLLPPLIFACLLTILLNARVWWLIPLHLATFFAIAMVCHRELAGRRPDVQRLTEFYIFMSFGGMLGGVFNSLVAPQIFSAIMEYPLVLALAALVRPSPAFRRSRPEPLQLLVGMPTLVLLMCAGMWAAGLIPTTLAIGPLLLALACLLTAAYMFANRTAPFGLMALMCVGVIAFGRPSTAGHVLHAARSFFGVHRVIDSFDHSHHLLQHGSTTHGRQEMPGTGCVPSGYHHPAGPIGQLFLISGERFRDVAVVGLGGGALACYAQPGDRWTFYEIDPVVERIARNPRYFTYLQNSPGTLNVVLGDGRLTLQRAAPATYDLIVLDAFSSDAIPVHLLTREAFTLYLSLLKPDGIVAVQISNRYLNLEPVLAALAEQDGLVALAKIDDHIPEADRGHFPSHWVMLARRRQPLTILARAPAWRSPIGRARLRPWTDDYSNIWQVFAPR
jgi:hypothetical protein